MAHSPKRKAVEAAEIAFLDHRTPWHRTPLAAAILATCPAQPPRCEWRRTQYVLTHDEWRVYVGSRAVALQGIYDTFADRALAEADRTGKPVRWHGGEWPTVTQAIDEALDEADERAVLPPRRLAPVHTALCPVASRVDRIHSIAGGQ